MGGDELALCNDRVYDHHSPGGRLCISPRCAPRYLGRDLGVCRHAEEFFQLWSCNLRATVARDERSEWLLLLDMRAARHLCLVARRIDMDFWQEDSRHFSEVGSDGKIWGQGRACLRIV